MAFSYDSMDRLTDETYPDGEKVEYAYNTQGELETLKGVVGTNTQYISALHYTPYNKVSYMAYGNGIATTYDYYDEAAKVDSTNNHAFSYRLRSILTTNEQILNLSYEYDCNDNIVWKKDANNNHARDEYYVYDELSRLTKAIGNYGTLDFAYDKINNITLKDNKTYLYQSTRPHAVTTAGTDTYAYDENGNMTRRNTSRVIAYNYDNRVTSITDEANTYTYTYDGASERMKKVENEVTTYYFFPKYEEEYKDGEAPNIVKYYFANKERIAQRSTKEGLEYFHKDHLGSSVRLSSESGQFVKEIGYKPFGEVYYSNNFFNTNIKVKYQYTDQELDATNLMDYGARLYDPALGRFISPDTILDGLNRYTYVKNSPVRYTDPTGYSWEDQVKDLGSGVKVNADGSTDLSKVDWNARTYGGSTNGTVPTPAPQQAPSQTPGPQQQQTRSWLDDVSDWWKGVCDWANEQAEKNRQNKIKFASDIADFFIKSDLERLGIKPTDPNYEREYHLRLMRLFPDCLDTSERGDDFAAAFVGGPEFKLLEQSMIKIGMWNAPKIFKNIRGQLTNGRYILDSTGMEKHLTGNLATEKSQFLFNIDAQKAVLDAASYADNMGLWVNNQAKVTVTNGPVGVLGKTGGLTSCIEVTRTATGFVHGWPALP
jgi:RHS repeat-associated protein